jgi:nucleoid-associated protein YgaU
MPAAWRAATALSLCLASSAAVAQAPAVAVARVGPPAVEADPGAGVTAVFRVTNAAARPREVTGRVELPTGWRLVTPDPTAVLEPRASDVRLLRVAIPAAAHAGSYRIRYALSASDGGAALGRDSLTVVVREQRRLELQPVDAPRMIVAGDRYSATFTLRNAGNAPMTAVVQAVGAQAVAVRTDSTRFRLTPGETRTIRVTVETRRDAERPVPNRLEVRAQGAGDTTFAARAYAVTEVIPRGGETGPRYHNLPAQLTLRSMQPQHSAQHEGVAELRAAGTISEGSATRVDILARGPNRTQSIFGERDEYRLALSSNRYELRLGDNGYALSPLTEPGRTGFGGSGRVSLGRATVGGFALRERWASAFSREVEQGGFVEMRLPGQSKFGVNYLNRQGRDSGDMWTLRGVLAPLPGLTTDLEYGAGVGTPGAGSALSIAVVGAHPRVNYGYRLLRAAPGYTGVVRGVDYDDASLSVRMWRALRLNTQFVDRSREPGPTDPIGVAQRYRSYRGGAGYADLVVAEYQHSEDAGRVIGVPVEGDENLVRLRLGSPAGPVRLFGGAELGSTQRGITPDRLPFQRYSLQSSVNLGGQSFVAGVERLTGTTLYVSRPQDVTTARFSTSLNVGRAMNVNFGWNGTRDVSDTTRTLSVLDGGVSYRLPFGHRIVSRARLLSFGGTATQDQSFVQLDYVIPLGVPVGTTGTSGRVQGRVYDAETGRGLPNTLVRLGDRAALTDRQGRVTFAGLAPETYYLQLDGQSLGTDRVTLQDNPLPVSARRGGTTKLDVGVVRGARVAGRVELFDFDARTRADDPARPLVEAGGGRHVLLALTRDGETVRRMTDADGRFVFADLRPGRWTLSVADAQLPEHHYFENDTLAVEIDAGEATDLTLRVLPQYRPVKMLASAEIVLGPGATSAEARPRALSRGATTSVAAPLATTVDGPDAPVRHRYTVTRWDISLMHIARVMYDDPSLWPKIWVANQHQLRDPDIILPGQRLLVPDASPLTRQEVAARDAYLAAATAHYGRAPSVPSVADRTAAAGDRREVPVVARRNRRVSRRQEPAVAVRPQPPVTRHTYTVTRWDVGLVYVARVMYDDASLWPKIWVANQHQLRDPDTIRPGQRLLIPDKAPLTSAEIAARLAYLAGKLPPTPPAAGTATISGVTSSRQ